MEGHAPVSARDKLFNDIWDMRSAKEKNDLIDAHRDEVALEIGRDALRDGLVPTLTRLVGEANAAKLLADLRDGYAHELAEKQRAEQARCEAEQRSRFGHLDRECEMQGEAVRHMADFIDPLKGAT
jgi:hypothetical protein